MSGSNAFRIRGINQAANRVSVQSSVQDTFMLTRRKFAGLLPKWHDVTMSRDELVVIKCQDGADFAEVEIEITSDKAGTFIARSSRGSSTSMGAGDKKVFTLQPGEALVLQGENIRHPTGQGAGISV